MSVTEQIAALVQPLLEDAGLELVDLEYKREQNGWTLRFFLDREGGISLDDCADASREISSLLDVEDIIQTAYNLEVSSPGIERPLKKLVDFERFSGKLARIKTCVALDPSDAGNPRKTFTGVLAGVEGDDILMNLSGQGESLVRISFQQIEKANLQYEF